MVRQDHVELLAHWHDVPPSPEFLTWTEKDALETICGDGGMIADQHKPFRDAYRMIVRDRNDLSMIGYASVYKFVDRMFLPDIGIALNRNQQGKGLGPEICRGLIAFTFNKFSDNAIQSTLNPENAGAMALNRKCGLQPFCFVKDGFVEGDYTEDDLYMRITREHFEKYGANPQPDLPVTRGRAISCPAP